MKNSAEGEDQPERIITRVKSNIGKSGGSFGYHIDAAPLMEQPDLEATRIVWDSFVEGEARHLLAEAEATDDGNRKASKLEQAKRWLKVRLENGECLQTTLQTEAAAFGISGRTLRRASREIGVKKVKEKEADGRWFWSLEDDQPY